MSERLARSFTGAAVTRVPHQNGAWVSDNGRLKVHIEPNRGPDGILRRGRYALKQRCEEYEAELINQGMIDLQWGKVWNLETPAPIQIPNLILSPEAMRLVLRDRDNRLKVYLPPVIPIEPVPLTPELPTPPPSPKLQIVVSNSTSDDPFQLNLFADEKRTPRLADFGGGVMPSEVAQEIELLRRLRRLTQQQLAAACKIARPTLANACRGRYPLGEWPSTRLREFLLPPTMSPLRAA